MDMQSPSSSSSFSYAFTYQVFLSFRGTDTRYGFTGNLYKALTDKGIHTFIDDRELQRGDEIKPSLDNAIEESRIFIPVFSPNYASSSFCLDELVHIIHCYKTKGRLILPIFFGVEPTNVRHQTGSYGEALAKHEERFQNNTDNMERLRKWKTALTQAANLSGDHRHPGYEYKLTGKIALNQTPDSSSNHCSQGYEYDFIGEIVKYISNKINRVPLDVAKHPVGLQSQVQQVKSLLDEGPDDEVHMVGIYGIGGLGKSTLAKAIYNFVADQFEGLCFLHDVRENSAQNNLQHLQEKLLSKTTGSEIKLDHVSEGIPIIKERLCRKKILLILDDVDSIRQLDALAGGLDWYGRGSRVIITTRNKHLLSTHGIKSTHAVEGLYETEAHQLLRWMAFKSDKVPSGYEDILNRAVAHASGLPLVIEVVGSNLFGKSIEEWWKYTLDGYDRIPNKEIQKILRVSYDALEEEEQRVFLDIACFLKGFYWEDAKYILHAHYGNYITHHLGVLADKSLIVYSEYGYVELHDLIKDMGKEVVRQESIKEPGKRSRLCCQDDIVRVLRENTGTSKIEMIYMNLHSMESVIDKKGKAFKKMTKLKTVIIENGHFSEGLKHLPRSLSVLRWKGCLSKCMSSSILNKKFQDMKVLILDQCKYLTHIPDVSGLSNLEKLSFEYCDNLITIHNSIGYLNKLERLSAYGCRELEHFPPLGLASLKELDLSGCESLDSFPELLCKMTKIDNICLHHTSIGELPFSFQNLSELHVLHLLGCGMLRFPKQNDKMYSIVFSNMTKLILSHCNLSDECLQIVLKRCVKVEELDLQYSNFNILPECLSECHHLVNINVRYCESLEEIRGIPPNLKELSAEECYSLSSSSRRMLMSQKLHEAGCTYFEFPNGTEPAIPDWFEHQSRGPTISFWFRKEIPSMTCIFILPEGNNYGTRVNFCVNGYETEIDYCYPSKFVLWNHTTLFHTLKLNELSKTQCEYNMEKGLLKNEWIHVECKLNDPWSFNGHSEEEKNKILSRVQMGIHVWKKKSNTEEKNVVFTDPYLKKIKLVDYLNYSNNTSFSQFVTPLKKQRLVEVGVSETEEEEGFSRKIDEDINASLQQQDLTKEEQRKTWGTFLSLGASESNTDGDEIQILSSAQLEEEDDVLFTNPSYKLTETT